MTNYYMAHAVDDVSYLWIQFNYYENYCSPEYWKLSFISFLYNVCFPIVSVCCNITLFFLPTEIKV